MKELREVSHDPLTNRVTRRIQEMILQGEVQPGDLLPTQAELAGRYGVGLSTIREAIKGLTVIGLVEPRAGRGTVVLPDALKILNNTTLMKANLGSLEADQVLEARLFIEGALSRLAASRASEEDIREIEAAIAEMRQAVDDSNSFVRADLRFHLAVARASKNDVLMQTYYLIQSLMEEVVRLADELPGGKERALRNHTQILEGIKRHEPEIAQSATEQQIADVIEYRSNG